MYRWEKIPQSLQEPWPGARRSHAMGRVPWSDELLMFGGFDGGPVLGDAWTLRLSLRTDATGASRADWRPAAAALIPVVPRHDHMFECVETKDRRLLALVGGMAESGNDLSEAGVDRENACLGETRVLEEDIDSSSQIDATSLGRWREKGGLPPRANAAVCRSQRGLVCFGGYTGSRCLDDVWLYEPNRETWRQLKPPNSGYQWPDVRAGHRMVAVSCLDGREERAYAFGGWNGGAKMHGDTWSLDIVASTNGLTRPWWRKEAVVGSAPDARACFTMTVLEEKQTSVVCALYGGLAVDWHARCPHLYTVDLPRPSDDQSRPVAFARLRTHGPCRPVAFHSACRLDGRQSADAYEPLLLVFGGGDGAGDLARNNADVLVLRKVLWHPRNAACFGAKFRCVAASVQRPAFHARLCAELWTHVLRLCEAAWFGDAPPVRLVVAPTHLSLSLPGRAAAAEDEHDDADSSSSVWETEESDDG